MAILLVTYDLKAPGRNYTPVHDYLKGYKHCKKLESVWLLDTAKAPKQIRDDLGNLIDKNDVVFVTKLDRSWAARNYPCGSWLNAPERNWA